VAQDSKWTSRGGALLSMVALPISKSRSCLICKYIDVSNRRRNQITSTALYHFYKLKIQLECIDLREPELSAEPPRPMQTYYEFRSLTSASVSPPIDLHLENWSGSPDAQPIALGTNLLRKDPQNQQAVQNPNRPNRQLDSNSFQESVGNFKPNSLPHRYWCSFPKFRLHCRLPRRVARLQRVEFQRNNQGTQWLEFVTIEPGRRSNCT
jgi:hypothetical protein